LRASAANRSVKTFALTLLALVAFAANSVLCRLALGEQSIDAASFTLLRLLSGAIVLVLILKLRDGGKIVPTKKSWTAGLLLFLYAATFSYAYLSLETGTGALILFSAVQITMVFGSILSGERLHRLEWFGMTLAFSGFVYLVLPGVSGPSATGFALMTCAGIAWGGYCLIGRNSATPLADTAGNFLSALPLAVLLLLVSLQSGHYTLAGIALALLSGGIASGGGYTIWSMALRGLTATEAAVTQLSVPLLAALGGLLFVAEAITLRLAVATVLILGGILLVVLGHSSPWGDQQPESDEGSGL